MVKSELEQVGQVNVVVTGDVPRLELETDGSSIFISRDLWLELEKIGASRREAASIVLFALAHELGHIINRPAEATMSPFERERAADALALRLIPGMAMGGASMIEKLRQLDTGEGSLSFEMGMSYCALQVELAVRALRLAELGALDPTGRQSSSWRDGKRSIVNELRRRQRAVIALATECRSATKLADPGMPRTAGEAQAEQRLVNLSTQSPPEMESDDPTLDSNAERYLRGVHFGVRTAVSAIGVLQWNKTGYNGGGGLLLDGWAMVPVARDAGLGLRGAVMLGSPYAEDSRSESLLLIGPTLETGRQLRKSLVYYGSGSLGYAQEVGKSGPGRGVWFGPSLGLAWKPTTWLNAGGGLELGAVVHGTNGFGTRVLLYGGPSVYLALSP